MEEKIVKYIRKHTMTVTSAVVIGFLLLAAGEYYLFRRVMNVSQIVSEGFMQLKETKPIKGQIIMKGGKMWIEMNGKTQALNMNIMLPDGTKVMTNGQVVLPDGTQMMMREGQTFDIK